MKIEAKAGRMNKVHISIDDEYKYTVDAEYWYSCPWCRVSEITDGEKQIEFLKDVGSRYAFISGLRALSYGDNSRKTLRTKLVTKGHVPEYVDIALDKLEEYGYINDTRFAKYLTERLISSKHMSKRGIKQELLAKGVDRETAENVLQEYEFDNVDAVCELLNTKYKRYAGDEKGIKKTVAALQRLGYNWSDIKSALQRTGFETEDFYND